MKSDKARTQAKKILQMFSQRNIERASISDLILMVYILRRAVRKLQFSELSDESLPSAGGGGNPGPRGMQ